MNRRDFLTRALVGAAAGFTASLPGLARAAAERRIEAVAFDAFPIFDPRPIFVLDLVGT